MSDNGKSYDDPVKALAREKLRDFIASELLPIKRARDIRVVCFPGAENEGEEALEVRQVYDPLGIPRENIVGLEYKADRAQRLRDANLGIEVVPGSAGDYFSREGKRFDVISLDYTGPKGVGVEEDIKTIIHRQMLGSVGVLALVNYAQRENKDLQKFLSERARREVLFSDSDKLEQVLSDSCPNLQRVMVDYRMKDKIEVSKSRDVFTKYLIELFCFGLTMRDEVCGETNSLLYSYPAFRDTVSAVEEIFQNKGPSWNRRSGKSLEEAIHWDNFLKYFVSLFDIQGDKNKEAYAMQLGSALVIASQRGYITKAFERYSYTSNSGASMEMDIFRLDQNIRYLERIKPNLKIDMGGVLRSLRFTSQGDSKRALKTFGEMANESNDFTQLVHTPLTPRVHLGSSYIPPKRKPRISKKNVIELIKDGCSTAEILECYSGFSIPQLSALRARHVTGSPGWKKKG